MYFIRIRKWNENPKREEKFLILERMRNSLKDLNIKKKNQYIRDIYVMLHGSKYLIILYYR